MKLRNKKTGEIIDLNKGSITDVGLGTKIQLQATDRYNKPIWIYNSLAELNEEWEDYEEPKEYWYINDLDGTPSKCELRASSYRDFDEWIKRRKQIGNYFDTREEAEKAVEKLKAWKRLKEARFEFTDFGYNLDEESSSIIGADGKICFNMLCYEDFSDDLELLFGGEE